MKRSILVSFLALAFCSCVYQQKAASSLPLHRTVSDAIGPWDNPYKGDRNLAGVWIYQLGENPYEQQSFEGRHPAAIWFYFWDGRVRQIDYLPDGTSYSDQWWPERLKQGDPFWDDVDFSHGSDPTFERHTDPRAKHKPVDA